MSDRTTLEFHRGLLGFSAGHFTIFSRTHRENLHGHNYYVEASIEAKIVEPGLTFNYLWVKSKLADFCLELDAKTLLPGESPYAWIKQEGDYTVVYFQEERIPFLPRDILILPLDNITLESLSRWFVHRLVAESNWVQDYGVSVVTIRVYNGLDHSASATWSSTSA